uniref:SH2 domain-containing protein n=2 Tax=Mesocestoides corti TaxID=53468 RepID=A0A5K3FIG1_MESCO
MLLPPNGSSVPYQRQITGWFPSNYVTMESSSKGTSASQPNNLNSSSQAPSVNEPEVLPLPAMSTKPSPMPSVSTAAASVSSPPAQLSASQKPLAPPSVASYSAVPFPTSSVFSSAQPQQPQPSPCTTSAPDGTGDVVDPASHDRLQHQETVLTLYPFTRNQAEELSFAADEILEVLDKPADDPDWWRCRNAVGNVGLVPRNYIRVIKNPFPSSHPPPLPHQSQPQYSSSVPPAVPQSHRVISGEGIRMAFALASANSAAFARKPWYWGVISRSECEAVLTDLAISGEFIIRDSESHPGDLTITMNAGAKNRNFKVHVENGEFHIGQKVFSSIDALIDNYRRHPIYKSDQEKHFLTRPFQHPDCANLLHNPPPLTSCLQPPMLMQSR